MPNPPVTPPDASMLAELQRVLETEIPMAASMGVCVESCGGTGSSDDAGNGLTISMPLDRNRNHQQTAFAGSLNALCTLTGWGMTYLELRRLAAPGAIVIRRSSIKYHQPVDASLVRAVCQPLSASRREYFQEMMEVKGQSKLDLEVVIDAPHATNADRPAVVFSGSYVVLPQG